MELLPCPFCGGKPSFQSGISMNQGGGVIAWVECNNCGASTKHVEDWYDYYFKEEAKRLWNTRLMPNYTV